MDFGKRLKQLREEKGLIQQDIADLLNVGRATIAGYETKGKQPDFDKLTKLAGFFGVTTDYLLGSTQDPKLTAKDEKDISKKLESILNEMSGSDALMFDGEKMDMDEESKELLKSSIENSLRLAKKLAKEKYTPKKYKK